MNTRTVVSAINRILGRGFQNVWSHKSSIISPIFSLLSPNSNFHSDSSNFQFKLFEKMVRMRPQPCVGVYNNILSVTVEMKHYTLALCMFHELRRMGAKVDDFTLTTAIKCYSLERRLLEGLFLDDDIPEALELFEDVEDLLNKLARLGIPLDIVALSLLMEAYCKLGMMEEAEIVLEEMSEKEFTADSDTSFHAK